MCVFVPGFWTYNLQPLLPVKRSIYKVTLTSFSNGNKKKIYILIRSLSFTVCFLKYLFIES